MHSPPKRRNHLKIEDKLTICQLHEQHPTLERGALGRLATETIQPGFVIDRHMVRKALLAKDKLRAMPMALHKRKNVPSQAVLQLDASVVEYFKEIVHEHKKRVRSRNVCKKVRLLRAAQGLLEHKIGKVTRNWTTRWMQRTGMTGARLHGEAGSVRKEAVEKGREAMKAITKDYHPDDIFNFDESSYFYRRESDFTYRLPNVQVVGTKKDKSRVTMVLGANCSGTEKLPLLILGTAMMPVPFRGHADRIHWVGIDKMQPKPPLLPPLFHYSPSPKGWMNGQIFHAWLRELDARMRCCDRHIPLLVDNVSSHKVGDIGLTNVRLEFLPKNTTAVLQPMDQGVIKATKDRIYNHRDDREFEFFEQKIFDFEKPDLFLACDWYAQSFNEISQQTIKNAWRKAGIVPDRTDLSWMCM